jgi:hypothetical protein
VGRSPSTHPDLAKGRRLKKKRNKFFVCLFQFQKQPCPARMAVVGGLTFNRFEFFLLNKTKKKNHIDQSVSTSLCFLMLQAKTPNRSVAL